MLQARQAAQIMGIADGISGGAWDEPFPFSAFTCWFRCFHSRPGSILRSFNWVKAVCWLCPALRSWILSAQRQGSSRTCHLSPLLMRNLWGLWLKLWPDLTLTGKQKNRKCAITASLDEHFLPRASHSLHIGACHSFRLSTLMCLWPLCVKLLFDYGAELIGVCSNAQGWREQSVSNLSSYASLHHTLRHRLYPPSHVEQHLPWWIKPMWQQVRLEHVCTLWQYCRHTRMTCKGTGWRRGGGPGCCQIIPQHRKVCL